MELNVNVWYSSNYYYILPFILSHMLMIPTDKELTRADKTRVLV